MDPGLGPVVVLGTYERFLFGFRVSTGQDPLSKVFTYPAHKGVVHAVTAASPFLVSGGGDEQLHAYDCKSNADLGTLLSPGGGGVYAAALFSMHSSNQATHLLSGAAEGNIVLWQAGNEWRVLKNMTGHRCCHFVNQCSDRPNEPLVGAASTQLSCTTCAATV